MHPTLTALVQLQAADDGIDALVARLADVPPRLAALDQERARVARQLEQATGQQRAAEARLRDVMHRVSEQRQRHERNLAQLDLVKRMREATAAASQVEAGERLLADGERDLHEHEAQVTAIGHAVEAHRAALADFDASLEGRRSALRAEEASIGAALAEARAAREGVAAAVPPALRTPYERLRGRRKGAVVFPVTAGACGACDTAIPLQRRSQMQLRAGLEPCEGCGMLLYAAE